MKYKVIATYCHEAIINTDEIGFQEYLKWRTSSLDKTMENKVITYAKRLFSYDIIDDDGHGTLTPSFFEWQILPLTK